MRNASIVGVKRKKGGLEPAVTWWYETLLTGRPHRNRAVGNHDNVIVLAKSDVTIRRWEAFTDGKAVPAGDGGTLGNNLLN